MRYLLRLSVAVAAVATPALAANAASAASVGGFSVRPSHFNPAVPSTRAYFQPSVTPGGRFSDEVTINNNAKHAIDLHVYPVDGVTSVTSGAVYTNRTDPVRGAARWVVPGTSYIHLAPGAEAHVPFTVHAPRGARAGDHLAGLAFEDAHPRHSGGRFSVTEVVRAVVGVEVTTPGPASPQIRLGHIALKALPGTQVPSVVVHMADVGGKLCKPRLAASLAGPGQPWRRVTRHLDTILPGDAIAFPLQWPRALRAGTYSATATATGCGAPQTVRANVVLNTGLRGTAGDPGTGSQSSGGGGTPMWLVLLVGVGGIVLGSLAARRLGTRRPKPPVAT
jgi:hypothetical protein